MSSQTVTEKTLRTNSTRSIEGSTIPRGSVESDDEKSSNSSKVIEQEENIHDSRKTRFSNDMPGIDPGSLFGDEHNHHQAPSRILSRGQSQGTFFHSELAGTSDIEVSLSLVAGLERTLFAALNNAWLLVMAGVGLNMVANNEEDAKRSGIFILVSAVICVVVATVLHMYRVWQIKNGKNISYSQTFFWTSLVGGLCFISLVLEIYYGLVRPYLLRDKLVSVAKDEDP